MNNPDRVRVRHMRDAAHEAISFARDRSRDELARDRMLLLSLVKELEIIGEAAGKISQELKLAFPQVPWVTAAGMRNRLIHAYRSEQHTSELQSPCNLVCRLLLEKNT